MLSCKFCELFNNTFLTKHLRPLHPHQNFDPHHSRLLFAQRHPRHPRHFFDPRQILWTHATQRHPRQNLTHATHESTHPRYPHHPPDLADSTRGHYFLIKIFMEKSIFILHIFFMHVLVFLNPLLKKWNLCST